MSKTYLVLSLGKPLIFQQDVSDDGVLHVLRSRPEFKCTHARGKKKKKKARKGKSYRTARRSRMECKDLLKAGLAWGNKLRLRVHAS